MGDNREYIGRAGYETLERFRRQLYTSMGRWGDALFELTDAVLSMAGPVTSIPHLSLEAPFRRSHGSLYKCLDRGTIDDHAIRDLLVASRPTNGPAIFAVDASTWPRCDAETSPGRGFYYSASKHSAGQPIVAGWSYQWISQLNFDPDSWTAPIDTRRLQPETSTTATTVSQVKDLVERLDIEDNHRAPIFVFDAGYDPIALSYELSAVPATILCRIRSDRVFYDNPTAPGPSTIGRPRRHGDRHECADPTTWGAPDHHQTTVDPVYGTVVVDAWENLHPKLGCRGHWIDHDQPPIVAGTIIRVDVQHLPRPAGAPLKTLWLWSSGPDPVDVDIAWRSYLRRFDIEHTFRFAKNTLGWTTPSLCTPEQADRWTWLTIAAYTQLRLARGLVDDHRLPWEKPRQPHQLTPARVRRGFRRIAPVIGTPARPPKSDTPGPGRPKGTPRPPRTRHPAIKKHTQAAA